MPRPKKLTDAEKRAWQAEYQRKYRNKPATKLKTASYKADPKNKARNLELARARYRKNFAMHKVRRVAYDRKYRDKPETKLKRAEWSKAWLSKPENKARQYELSRIYNNQPKVRARVKLLNRIRYHRRQVAKRKALQAEEKAWHKEQKRIANARRTELKRMSRAYHLEYYRRISKEDYRSQNLMPANAEYCLDDRTLNEKVQAELDKIVRYQENNELAEPEISRVRKLERKYTALLTRLTSA